MVRRLTFFSWWKEGTVDGMKRFTTKIVYDLATQNFIISFQDSHDTVTLSEVRACSAAKEPTHHMCFLFSFLCAVFFLVQVVGMAYLWFTMVFVSTMFRCSDWVVFFFQVVGRTGPLTQWDLRVNGTIDLLGRRITLMQSDEATLRWIDNRFVGCVCVCLCKS